jgi:uncharacterized protein (DUF849 family)
MSGRWKQEEEERQQQRHSKSEEAKVPSTKNKSSIVDSLPSVGRSAAAAASTIAGMPAQLRLGESKLDSTLFRDALQRQRIMDVSMTSTTLAGSRPTMSGDEYINALASLKHREAMLNLDKAIHEARALRLASAMKNDTKKDTTPSDGSAASSISGGLSRGVPISPSLATSLNTYPLLSGFVPGSIQERLAFHSSLLAGIRQGHNVFPPMASAAAVREKMLQWQMQQQLLKSVSSSVEQQQLLECMKNVRSPH